MTGGGCDDGWGDDKLWTVADPEFALCGQGRVLSVGGNVLVRSESCGIDVGKCSCSFPQAGPGSNPTHGDDGEMK